MVASTGEPLAYAQSDEAFRQRIRFFDSVLRAWLDRPGVTLACGRWESAGLAEFVLNGNAEVLASPYGACFAGVREIRIGGTRHHLHVDFGRIHAVEYTISPCVCFGQRPSFEVRFLLECSGGRPTGDWAMSLMITQPYAGDSLLRDEVAWFVRTALRHLDDAPTFVSLKYVPGPGPNEDLRAFVREIAGDEIGAAPDLSAAFVALQQRKRGRSGGGRAAPQEPLCIGLLNEALRLAEASLVIYRHQLLVEFQTDKLSDVQAYEEAGYVSWQIGALSEHHCHLALTRVARCLFSAERVPCQQSRLNFTLWFLVDGDCGNPYRRDGYFSVVLNAPYEGTRLRREIVDPMFDLYRRFRTEAWVGADAAFLEAEDVLLNDRNTSCRG